MQLLLEGLVRSVARIGNPGIKAYIPGDNINYFNTNQKQRDREHNSFHLPFSGHGGNVCFHFHPSESQERFLCTCIWEMLKLHCSFQPSLSTCGRDPELNYLCRTVRTRQVLVCLGPLNTSKLSLSPHLSALPTFTWVIPSPISGLPSPGVPPWASPRISPGPPWCYHSISTDHSLVCLPFQTVKSFRVRSSGLVYYFIPRA